MDAGSNYVPPEPIESIQHSARNVPPAVAIHSAMVVVNFDVRKPSGDREIVQRCLFLKTDGESLLDPEAFPKAYEAICLLRSALESDNRPTLKKSVQRSIERTKQFFKTLNRSKQR